MGCHEPEKRIVILYCKISIAMLHEPVLIWRLSQSHEVLNAQLHEMLKLR
jgi:hypothetical protein